MASDHNALAELAERLDAMPVRGKHCLAEILDLAKAQRIVAELAKVEDNMLNASCTVAMLMRCRAIAEEGANDGSR